MDTDAKIQAPPLRAKARLTFTASGIVLRVPMNTSELADFLKARELVQPDAPDGADIISDPEEDIPVDISLGLEWPKEYLEHLSGVRLRLYELQNAFNAECPDPDDEPEENELYVRDHLNRVDQLEDELWEFDWPELSG